MAPPRPLGERVGRPLVREESVGMAAESPGEVRPVPAEPPEPRGLAPGWVGEVGESRPLIPRLAAFWAYAVCPVSPTMAACCWSSYGGGGYSHGKAGRAPCYQLT